jgi:hypothetical protein
MFLWGLLQTLSPPAGLVHVLPIPFSGVHSHLVSAPSFRTYKLCDVLISLTSSPFCVEPCSGWYANGVYVQTISLVLPLLLTEGYLKCTVNIIRWSGIHWCCWVSESVPGVVQSLYGLDDRGIRVLFPAGVRDFSLLSCTQTASEVHPASCPMSTGTFPGKKAVWALIWTLSIQCRE